VLNNSSKSLGNSKRWGKYIIISISWNCISWQVFLTYSSFQQHFSQLLTNWNGCRRCGLVELLHGWQQQPYCVLWVCDVSIAFCDNKTWHLTWFLPDLYRFNTTVLSTIDSIAWERERRLVAPPQEERQRDADSEVETWIFRCRWCRWLSGRLLQVMDQWMQRVG
jgi:hypothetical protein